MARHDRLLVWRQAKHLAVCVYKASEQWPSTSRFGLTDQARRAALSVPANIAEGAGRYGTREFKRYMDIALGSLGELHSHLSVAHELEYLTDEEWKAIEEQHTSVSKLAWLLAKSLRR